MSYKPLEVAIGALVLIVAAGFLAYSASAVGFGSSTDGYQLKASFRSSDGVSLGTDVRMAGVKVGTVTDLSLNPETYRAEVMFQVQEGLKIPDDSGVAVSQEGLLGGTFVEIIPGGSDFALEDGGEFLETQGSVSLIQLLLKFVAGQES